MNYKIASDDNGLYLTSEHGQLINTTQWVEVDGITYRVKNGYIVTNAWLQYQAPSADESKWYYVGSDGKFVANAFVRDSKGLAYLGDDGSFNDNFTDWVNINGKYYYAINGYQIQNAWQPDFTGKCYLGSDGVMVSLEKEGWAFLGDDWYYIVKKGTDCCYRAENQWINDAKNGGACYVDASGKRVKNEFRLKGTKQAYINEDGCFDSEYTGWLKLNNSWYYLDKGFRQDDKWLEIEDLNNKNIKRLFYVGPEGILRTNDLIYFTEADGTTTKRYVNSEGYFDTEFTGTINLVGKGTYYITKGVVIGDMWKTDKYGSYYINSNGFMVVNKRLTVDGAQHNISKFGYCADSHRHPKQ